MGNGLRGCIFLRRRISESLDCIFPGTADHGEVGILGSWNTQPLVEWDGALSYAPIPPIGSRRCLDCTAENHSA